MEPLNSSANSIGSIFLTAEWRKLAIVNYSIDPLILMPYLPNKTEFDLWNDKCLVSLVGFRFINTKIKGILIASKAENVTAFER